LCPWNELKIRPQSWVDHAVAAGLPRGAASVAAVAVDVVAVVAGLAGILDAGA